MQDWSYSTRMSHYITFKTEDLWQRDDTISVSNPGVDEDMAYLKREGLLGSGSVRLATPESGDKQSVNVVERMRLVL